MIVQRTKTSKRSMILSIQMRYQQPCHSQDNSSQTYMDTVALTITAMKRTTLETWRMTCVQDQPHHAILVCANPTCRVVIDSREKCQLTNHSLDPMAL